MLNLVQFLLAIVLVGYILIGHWESLPMLVALAWHERAIPLYIWCHLYVVSSALLALWFSAGHQFSPLNGWRLGVVWTTSVIAALFPIIAAQFFLFVLAPKGILTILIANIVGGTAGILIGNVLVIMYNSLMSLSVLFVASAKNPFILELHMLAACESMKIIPPTTRAISWPAKATISLMVGYEIIRDWGWI